MDGFPQDQIERVVRLKELLISQAQAIYEPEPPYTGGFDIMQCSPSGTFVAYIIVYPEPETIHSRKCLLSGQSTTSAVNALEDLWNKIQTDINSSIRDMDAEKQVLKCLKGPSVD